MPYLTQKQFDSLTRSARRVDGSRVDEIISEVMTMQESTSTPKPAPTHVILVGVNDLGEFNEVFRPVRAFPDTPAGRTLAMAWVNGVQAVHPYDEAMVARRIPSGVISPDDPSTDAIPLADLIG